MALMPRCGACLGQRPCAAGVCALGACQRVGLNSAGAGHAACMHAHARTLPVMCVHATCAEWYHMQGCVCKAFQTKDLFEWLTLKRSVQHRAPETLPRTTGGPPVVGGGVMC